MVPVLPPPCRKANRRIRVSLRLEHWPTADQEAWRALFTTGDLFDESGPGAHLSHRTRTSLENVYGRWLAFLVRTEPHGLDEALGERITRERIVSFAHHLAETNIATSVAGQLRFLRGALRLLAADQDWAWLLTIAKRIEARAERRSKRHRLRTSDELFALGFQLMQEGEVPLEDGRITKQAALTYRDGLIIALLAVAPMRRGNLAGLTLGQHLQRVGGSWIVMLKASETKNRRALGYSLPARLGSALERYLERFRPVLFGSAAHRGVWASAKGVPLTGNAIYDAVCRRTRKAFGQPVNLHLFRDGAATFWALKDPTRVTAVSGLLGHEPRVTERHYNQASGISAGRKLADALARQMCTDPACEGAAFQRDEPAPTPRAGLR
jgi:integrase/recombinase XerD